MLATTLPIPCRRRPSPEVLLKLGKVRFGNIETIRQARTAHQMLREMREIFMMNPTGFGGEDKSEDLPFQILHFLKEYGYTFDDESTRRVIWREEVE